MFLLFQYKTFIYHPFLFRSILENNQTWLNDIIINVAQTLLKSKYGTPGLQNTLLAAALQGCIVGGEEFVQVLNSGGNHWLTVADPGGGVQGVWTPPPPPSNLNMNITSI